MVTFTSSILSLLLFLLLVLTSNYRYRSERSYGKVQRTLPLPKGANHDGAVAKFENGVLTVSFPKVKGGSSDAGRKLLIK